MVASRSLLQEVVGIHALQSNKTKMSKIHGDLTLDNIIFNKNKIFIIDWEFFYSKKKHFGYDLAYLFLSALCIPYLTKKKISSNDEKLFLDLWKILKKIGVNKKIILDPFTYFEKKIKDDSFLKKSYILSKKKFFPFLIDKSYKRRVCSLIKGKFYI